MKKRMHRHGFTLAEILITLVIIGFIGALGVPMLGQKKLQKPAEALERHGTMECFYNGSQLIQFTSDNVDDRSGTETVVSGACYFKAPPANRFVLQAVGAGGDGAHGLYTTPSYVSATTNISGSVSMGTDFLTSIQSEDVPDWVREEWNKQWDSIPKENWPQYTLLSPVGASGDGKCVPIRDDYKYGTFNEECQYTCADDISRCPADCRSDLKADGGDSGKGAQYIVRAKLEYDPNGVKDNVRFTQKTTETTLSFNSGKYISLKPSGDGKDGEVVKATGESRRGENGEDFNINNNDRTEIAGEIEVVSAVQLNNAQAGGIGCGRAAVWAKAGSVSGGGGSIPYETQSLAIRATFGVAGAPGTNEIKMLENIPSGTEMRLIPAASTSQRSVIQIKDTDGSWRDFLIAQSGSDGATYNNYLIPVSKDDLPFPKEYYPTAFEGSAPSISVASANGYTSRLAELIKNGLAPGKSGAGAFPIVTHIEGSAVHKINGVQTGTESLEPISGAGGGSASIACPSGGTSEGTGYCTATGGNPGAIVISW